MPLAGTDAYQGVHDLPPLVELAVAAARRAGFGKSCRPSHGRLLAVLAGGIGDGVIGETGTGCGVGLAWLASGARPGVRLVSIEHDRRLAEVAREVFAGVPAVTVRDGEWAELRGSGPFELLALDGGGPGQGDGGPPAGPGQGDGGPGQGDAGPSACPREWLRPGGALVMDDFTPDRGWPPLHEGRPDAARLHWLQHPDLLATQIRTEPGAATIVATFRG